MVPNCAKHYNDQIEKDEDAICGKEYDESILENEDTSWAVEVLNKNKTALRSLTAKEIIEFMPLHDELKSNYNSGLNRLESSSKFKQLCSMINVFKTEPSNLSRTAKFWTQYLGYLKILGEFNRAARTGNWSLHLESVSRTINLFAATDHVYYAKCSKLYLQQMLELETVSLGV